MREYKIKDIKNMKDKKTLQNQITNKTFYPALTPEHGRIL